MEPRSLAWYLHRFVLVSAYFACVALLLCAVSRSWHPQFRLTSLIHFGSKFEQRSLDKLKNVPHVTLPDSDGYDGQFYAQLALSPTLGDPQLPRAIDNVAYRSRRILFSWTAWLLGWGRPERIICAYAFQNTLFWLGNAVLLLYWLPPTRWFNFFRWVGILFSSGWLESISTSVLDGPAFFLLLLALWLTERGDSIWGTALLGISGLGKETNLLAGFAVFRSALRERQTWRALCLRAVLLVLPLLVWLSIVEFRVGLARSAGRRNFAVPFLGWASKCDQLLSDARLHGWQTRDILASCCVAAVIIQIVHFATRRNMRSAWWRLGLPYSILGVCLGTAVMEGHPGAFTRALLPLTAAFNLSLTASPRGWLLLLMGNLHVLAGLAALGIIPT